MKEISFTIPYPRCKGFSKMYSLNAIYAGKSPWQRRRDAEFWHNLTRGSLSKQGIRRGPFSRPVEIIFLWNDRLDCSNHAYIAKMIEDALRGCLIVDDSRKYVRRIVHEFHEDREIRVIVRESNGKD